LRAILTDFAWACDSRVQRQSAGDERFELIIALVVMIIALWL
jgi:hypothetical protein